MIRIIFSFFFLSFSLNAQNLSFDLLYTLKSGDANLGVTFEELDGFGSRVESIGDLNEDGIDDIVVSSATRGKSSTGNANGALFVLFLNSDGTVKSHVEISENKGGFNAPLSSYPYSYFGYGLAVIDDLDNDGIPELAVGAREYGPSEHGAVFILFLNRDGTVKKHTEIGSNTGGYTGSGYKKRFGSSICNAGDLNGDNISDILVGEPYSGTVGSQMGAVNILYMDTTGYVKSFEKILPSAPHFTNVNSNSSFGFKLSNIGDIDKNGSDDFIIGSGKNQAWIVRFGANASIVGTSIIDENDSIIGDVIKSNSGFAAGVEVCTDFDHDGINELSIASPFGQTGTKGETYICYIDSLGKITKYEIINETSINNLTLGNNGQFGISTTYIGDINGDGFPEFAIGEIKYDDGTSHGGAVHFITLKPRECSEKECVWPGDANNDGIANVWDLANIVLNYNETKIDKKRILPNENWYGQFGENWGISKLSADQKFSDGNGDGTINYDDVLLISKNYNETHLKTESSIDIDPNGPPIKITTNKEIVYPSDSVDFTITLGDEYTPAEGVYSVTMSLRHQNTSVFGSTNKAFFDDCWLGTEGVDMITLSQSFDNGVDISLGRIDQQNKTGKGSLSTIRIIVPDNLGEIANTDLILTLDDVLIISYQEDTILPGEISLDTVVVIANGTHVVNKKEEYVASIFPNPSNRNIRVKSDKMISSIRILDMQGKLLQENQYNNTKETVLITSNLISGTYFVVVQSEKWIENHLFIKK